MTPVFSKLIKCLSKSASILGDSKIPFSESKRSSLFDSDQGTIWDEINICLMLDFDTGQV